MVSQGCIWELIGEVSRWTQKDWIILMSYSWSSPLRPLTKTPHYHLTTSSSAKSAYLLLLTHSMCVCLYVYMSGLKHVCDYRKETHSHVAERQILTWKGICTSLADDESLLLISLRLGVLGDFPEGPAADLSFTFCGVWNKKQVNYLNLEKFKLTLIYIVVLYTSSLTAASH